MLNTRLARRLWGDDGAAVGQLLFIPGPSQVAMGPASRPMRVVGVVQWAEPRTLTSRTVGKPSLYVLEVPGGWASKNGVRAGSTVELEGPLKTRPGQP